MTLDSKNITPLYKQLVNNICNDIKLGKYKAGGKLPTEQEMSQIYGVSRVTVRTALAELTEQNLLTRIRGKGTFITPNKISRSIQGIRSFSDTCYETGHKPGAKVMKSIIEPATPEDIKDLHLESGANVIVIERLRFADNVPVSYDISRFPESFSFLLQEDLNDCSMFDILRKKYNIIFENSYKTLELTYATHQMCVYLQISNSHPLLTIFSISSTVDGIPSHRSYQYIVGDKFKLIV